MTQDEIIRMAREAGCINDEWMDAIMPFLRNFAAIVSQHERDACAKVCEQLYLPNDGVAAAAIRARVEVQGCE